MDNKLDGSCVLRGGGYHTPWTKKQHFKKKGVPQGYLVFLSLSEIAFLIYGTVLNMVPNSRFKVRTFSV